MKKVLLTSMILLSAVSLGGNIYAQGTAGGNDTEVTTPSATQPSVKFTADGNTLTISGQGDLTSYMTTDYSAKVFTDNAVGFVFTDADGKKSVAAGESYNAGKTYYQAEYSYTKVLEGSVPQQFQNGFAQVEAKQYWNEEKLGNLYYGYYNNWGEKNSITIESKITSSSQIQTQGWSSANDSYDYKDMAVYFVCEGEVNKGTYTFDELESKQIRMITLADFNKEYIKSEATYYVQGNPSLFKSTDGGNTFLGLSPNVKYTWTPDDVFYQGTASYAEIENNEDFFGEKGTHSDYLQADNSTLSFNQLLLRKITEGSYEKVEFVNTGSDNLLINAEIVQSILFPNGNQNGTIKELDLGQATIENLNNQVFDNPSAPNSYSTTLETLTLPLTNTTSVKSEKTQEYVQKMVVPTEVIPGGYTNVHAKLTKVIVPERYQRVGEFAFSANKQQTYALNDKLEKVVLPKTLEVIEAHAFELCTKITSINLEEGLENIGEKAFYATGLTSVHFPSTLRIINDGAFYCCEILNIKFNAGLKFIGNAAFAKANVKEEDAAETTIEIPASVRYIGPWAFNFRQYQDVFFYGTTAPLMPLGDHKYDAQQYPNGTAFPEHTLMGNNGFDKGKAPSAEKTADEIMDRAETGYANRENYKTHGVYFCIMHFPKDLSDEQRDTYTDITRIYKTSEEGKDFVFSKTDQNSDSYDTPGKEDPTTKWESLDKKWFVESNTVNLGYQDTYLGRQYIWPSQNQWQRAYIVTQNGYKWNGVDKYKYSLTEDDIATLKYAGYEIGDGEGQYTQEKLEEIAHMGTRLFVLTNGDVNKVDENDEDKEPEYPVDVKGGEWWTICLPFNMTKAMVDETFGENTQVCLFDRVRRVVNRKTSTNRIILYFTQNVYKHKTAPKKADGTWNFQESAPAPKDDEIVIYAHESYMIHPTKTGEDAVFAVKNYQPVVGSPTPTIVVGKNEYIGESDIPDNVPYRYVGNYLQKVDAQTENQSVATQGLQDVKIPKFSYVYASDGKETKFWFLTDDDMTWMPNKCVVQTNTRGDGQNDYEEFFDFTVSPAKQSSFFGEDFIDTPTSIEDEMVIIAGEGSDAPVYSLDGTLVNTTGDLTGLPKGVYIKGGKKYVVK